MNTTVFAAFMATAEHAGSAPFLCVPPRRERAYHPAGIELTYAEVREAVLELRRAYEDAGYGHGHRVALLLENRPEFFFHYLALNALGCSVVPVNPDYRHDELLYQMDHSEADLAVVIGARVADLEAVARERVKLLPVVDAEAWPATLPMASVARAEASGPRHGCGLSIPPDHGTPRVRAQQLITSTQARGTGTEAASPRARARAHPQSAASFHMNCQR